MKIYFTNQLSYNVSKLQRTNFAGSNVMAITEFDLIDKSQGSVTRLLAINAHAYILFCKIERL